MKEGGLPGDLGCATILSPPLDVNFETIIAFGHSIEDCGSLRSSGSSGSSS